MGVDRDNLWKITDKAGIIIKLVGGIIATVVALYASKPIINDVFGLSRVSELRNARVTYSISGESGEYTIEVRKLRSECPIISLHIGGRIGVENYSIELDRKPYQLSEDKEIWRKLRFKAKVSGYRMVAGKGILYGTAQYQCPEGKVLIQFPENSTIEIKD